MVHTSIQAAKRAFESLNVVMFDKRWVGDRATVAKVLHQQLPTVESNGLSVVRVIAVAQGNLVQSGHGCIKSPKRRIA